MKTLKTVLSVFALAAFFAAATSAQTVLTTLNGDQVDVEGQRGKVVILAVGATWLPLSAKQAEYTNKLAKMYAGKDVKVYFVTTDSDSAKSKNYADGDGIKKFATAAKLTVPVLRDPDGAATLKKFGIDQIPSFVILDKQGNISGQPFGGIDPKFDITAPISKSVDGLL